jgi:histidine triad (HIT) family protein
MPASDCVFCKIAAGSFGTQFITEDDTVVSFADLAPQAPVHALVIPRQHLTSLGHAVDGDAALLGNLLSHAREVAVRLGIAQTGYRTVINTGDHGGQSVSHLHVHVLGGRPMRWPPG